ncbi:receptor-interacting serine/threonine-protein kinase 3 [Plectropomus leopardus]|uniref:receptor-interacting serine/threonine-protein kinase 3 n=1 Tax=Plectropomus leopardus TaxID=160734 RepID=UPI001C4D16EB|nr:receptor-interacting serine/threonine-protein kinase 3 [Plectropomus leopardus]
MALFSCAAPSWIEDSSLQGWKVIGSGGFGQVYKARHRQWGCDVAIKLLHYNDGNSTSLLREIDMMRQASSPLVIQVRGVFRGQVPNFGPSTHLGLVMELMERGSLASLQQTLGGAPPWPLVFRLAHQVALGINFLHSLSPPLLHLDLKPSNVLLGSYLDAKLTDFGLARFYHSIKRVSKTDSEGEGGTLSYMPPEAFHASYNPTRASDIYSYGILLWSIVTGKQPYAHAQSSIVRLRIPEGDRPSLEEIMCHAQGLAGLTRLTELMMQCWDTRPEQRPLAFKCTTVTEELYKMHKHAINDAVHQVVKQLDQREEERITEQVQRGQITQKSEGECFQEENICDSVPTGPPPVQERADVRPANQRDQVRVKDPHSFQPVHMHHGDVRRPSTNYKGKSSSGSPIGSAPSSPSSGRSSKGRTQPPKNSQLDSRKQMSPQYQRQSSSPDTPSPAWRIQMNLSNVTGFQQGNNNTMHIQVLDPRDRKRHPTAPSRLNLPHIGNWRDKTGGVG